VLREGQGLCPRLLRSEGLRASEVLRARLLRSEDLLPEALPQGSDLPSEVRG